MNEHDLDVKTNRLLSFRNCFYYKVQASGTQKSGIPDFLMIEKGRPIWIENKNPNGKGHLSVLQSAQIDLILNVGAYIIVSDSIDYTSRCLFQILDKGSYEHQYIPEPYLTQHKENLKKAFVKVRRPKEEDE